MDGKDLLLGIDIGTTGAKCTFYSLAGEPVASGYEEYPMIRPQPDWAEQDPLRWWKAVCGNIAKCVAQGVDTRRVAAAAVSSTNAVLLADAAGQAVCNAIGLHDQRSEPEAQWLREHVGEEAVLAETGNRIARGSFALPTLMWLARHRPDLVARSAKFLIPNGYIIARLTGEFSIDAPRSGLTLLNDLKNGGWSATMAEAAGIERRLLPPVYASTAIVGTVTREAARETGLAQGTPIAAGAIDTVAATIGAGACAPGDAAITIGSSGRVASVSATPLFDRRILSTPGAFADQYMAVQSSDNAGISLRWFRDTFGKVVADDCRAHGTGPYDELNAHCAASTPGAGGLIYLPYLTGEKSPIWDAKARGVFFGASLSTGFADFTRAVMEGVAYSMRHCMSMVPGLIDGSGSPIPIGGGAARSRVWCQIFADVLGRPVIQLPDAQTETLGDILIAAEAIGIEGSGRELGRRIAQRGRLLEPCRSNAGVYDAGFARYLELYQRLRTLF